MSPQTAYFELNLRKDRTDQVTYMILLTPVMNVTLCRLMEHLNLDSAFCGFTLFLFVVSSEQQMHL